MGNKGSLQVNDVQISSSSAAASKSTLRPNTKKDVMVGFENDLLAIKSRLCGGRSKLQVIPIFGMGGIGKTTLARNAYEDPLTVEQFHICAWVTVSQQYSARNILSSILATTKPSTEGLQCERSIDDMSDLVFQSLKGNKYLIVMDDMWNTEAWDGVKRFFPDDCEGSRIILTTRLFDVATYVASLNSGSSPPHKVQFMDVDQSWNLLRQKVFGDENCPAELENIGRIIAENCKGLPLAIVVIAGLLSTVSKTPDSWEEIARNVNQVLTEDVEQFADQVLSLSYNYLPLHLIPCFLYMGMFPEDYEIYTWKLFKLWEAEGFLEESGSKSSEEQAEEYLEGLLRRSLVLVIKRKTNGKIKMFRIHDLVRRLCIKKAEEDKFLLHYTNSYSRGGVLPKRVKDEHRLCIDHSFLNWPKNIQGSAIHTFICFCCVSDQSEIFLQNMRLLRVLDMTRCSTLNVNELIRGMYEQCQLRCLSLDRHYMGYFPEISHFRNLQSVIVHPGKAYKYYKQYPFEFPLEVWGMTQLRHLVACVFSSFPYPKEDNLQALVNLQTFSEVTDFVCTEKVRKLVPNLKKLGVCYATANGDSAYYDLGGLEHLHQLEKFKLQVHHHFRFGKMLNPTFPNSLRKLTLSGWHRPWEDTLIIGSLPNLNILKLRDYAFRGAKWETVEETFRQLKFLLIDKSDLQDWITETDHFPRLESLVLYRCWCLSKIPDCIGEISSLKLIKVDETKRVVESAKSMQKELQEYWGNDTLQVCTGRYNIMTKDIK